MAMMKKTMDGNEAAAYAAYAMCSTRIGWIDLAEREESEAGNEIEWPVSKGVKYWYPDVG